METKIIVIYTTFPDLKTARKVVRDLIRQKLAACSNIFRISSVYTWKGKIEETSEYGSFIKTTKKNYKKVEYYIKENHPYEVPEIVSWTIERGLGSYLKWVATFT